MDSQCIVSQLVQTPFFGRPYQEKLQIVVRGRPRPEMPALVTKHTAKGRTFNRRFHTTEYDKVPWLTASSVLNKLYCWPCLLFNPNLSSWGKEGISNLSAFSNAVKKHQKCHQHIFSQLMLTTFGKSRVDLELDELQRIHVSRHNKLVSCNRDILKRLIDSVCHLAKLEAPFSGCDESSSFLNKGHNLELLSLIGSYDSVLKNHMDTTTELRGTFHHIQNDLIEAVREVVLDRIKEEVRNAPFVAIILGETTDTMNASQLSSVLRYATEDGSVKERFVGFIDVSTDKTPEGLFRHVLKIADEFHIDERKLVAQTYDGAAVMSGHLSGLSTRVLEKFPKASFVHCFSHQLNLVLLQECMSIKECRIFFPTLSCLAAYFSKSPQRSKELNAFMTKRLPGVAPSRWISPLQPVYTVWDFQPQLIEFFNYLIDDTPGDLDNDSLVKAQGFRSFLKDFRNSFLLASFARIFRHTDVLYDIEEDEIDLTHCFMKLNETQQHLTEDRECFIDVWEEVIAKSNLCGIEEPHPPKKRRNGGRDVGVQETSRRLYNEILDKITSQLQDRFSSMERFKFMSLFNPRSFESFFIIFPKELFTLLQDFYGDLFDCERLKSELRVIYSWEAFRGKSPHALVADIHKLGLKNIFPEVYRLASLVLTIPNTKATDARYSSVCKRIESYNLATIGQDRMSPMSLLAIEKEVLCDLQQTPAFYTSVTEVFAKRSQRMELNYK